MVAAFMAVTCKTVPKLRIDRLGRDFSLTSGTSKQFLSENFAECGPYRFENCHSPDTGYLLQTWQIRPEEWPPLVWEMDGYGLYEGAGRTPGWPARSGHPGGLAHLSHFLTEKRRD